MLRRAPGLVLAALVALPAVGCGAEAAVAEPPDTVVPWTGPATTSTTSTSTTSTTSTSTTSTTSATATLPRGEEPAPAALADVPDPRLDLLLARDVATRPTDLGEDWVECCVPSAFDEASLDDHICAAPEGLPPHTAGFHRQYALNFEPDYSHDSFLSSAAIIAGTEELAELEWTGIDAPGYEACLLGFVRDMIAGKYLQDPTSPISTDYQRTTLDVGVPAVAEDVALTAHTPWGDLHFFVTRARALVGRVIVRIEITRFDGPIPRDALRTIVEPVVGRARAGQ